MSDLNRDALREFAGQYLEAAKLLDADALTDAYGSALANMDENTACEFKVAVQSVAMAGFTPDVESKALSSLEDMREGITFCTTQSEKQWIQNLDFGTPGMD